jgi:hypothetical protein
MVNNRVQDIENVDIVNVDEETLDDYCQDINSDYGNCQSYFYMFLFISLIIFISVVL